MQSVGLMKKIRFQHFLTTDLKQVLITFFSTKTSKRIFFFVLTKIHCYCLSATTALKLDTHIAYRRVPFVTSLHLISFPCSMFQIKKQLFRTFSHCRIHASNAYIYTDCAQLNSPIIKLA